MAIPEKLQEIVDDFALASREEKVEMLIQYAESLPELPERLQGERAKMDAVPECMTPVFLFAEKQAGGGLQFHFDIPPQSPTVRGLAAILANGLNGSRPEEIIAVPADFFSPMNLQEAISYQRLNGFQGVLAHMKQAAVRLLDEKA
ncbi:MAG TPA: SufE family protein [Anaerolineales bacterium]|jgi:cysteine desulfuration protein SufE